MKDFILASLPWVICGISIAIIVVNCNKEKDKDLSKKTYLSEGMCLGMLIGEAIGSCIKKGKNNKEDK